MFLYSREPSVSLKGRNINLDLRVLTLIYSRRIRIFLGQPAGPEDLHGLAGHFKGGLGGQALAGHSMGSRGPISTPVVDGHAPMETFRPWHFE
jgi:hypothetical protein